MHACASQFLVQSHMNITNYCLLFIDLKSLNWSLGIGPGNVCEILYQGTMIIPSILELPHVNFCRFQGSVVFPLGVGILPNLPFVDSVGSEHCPAFVFVSSWVWGLFHGFGDWPGYPLCSLCRFQVTAVISGVWRFSSLPFIGSRGWWPYLWSGQGPFYSLQSPWLYSYL